MIRAISLWLILATFVGGCAAAERYIFQTDLRRKSYPITLDSDHDGLTDREELAAGYDPDNPDTNGNDINDSDDDDDGDGMSNAWEIALGFDPNGSDSASSIYGSHFGGNGVNDCDEDLDGDGIPNCWEINNDLDPANPSDGNQDADGDGYTAAQEYPDFDPNDPDSHPAGEKDLVLYDNNLVIEGRTNSLQVRGTARFCFGGDKLLLTSSATKPAANATGWVDCTVAALALSGTLGASTEGQQQMYLWRKNATGVNPTPVAATVVYDVTGPTGNLVVSDRGFTWIELTLTPPSDADYTSIVLRRYDGLSCADKSATEGTSLPAIISTTSYRDENLPADTQYCYKVFWSDDLGNVDSLVANVETVPAKTKAVTDCELATTGHNVWYVNASVAYSVTCASEIESVEDSLGNWPNFISLTSTVPHANSYTLSGTPSSAMGLTNWSALINDVHTESFSTRVLNGSGIVYDADDTLTLPTNTNTAFDISAQLDAVYDGADSDVDIKGLMGNAVSPATTSNGTVVATETDIPLLSYTDSGACASGVTPYICAGSGSYASGTKLASGTMSLLWNYSAHDHGEYFVRTKSYVTADDAPLYGSQETMLVTTENMTNADTEWTHTLNACVGCLVDPALTHGANVWHFFQPQVAFHQVSSTSEDQKIGMVYSATETQIKQFAGVTSVDRTAGTQTSSSVTRGLEATGATEIQLTADLVSSRSMAIAPTSATNGTTWVSINVQQVPPSIFDLTIGELLSDGTTVNKINLSDFVANAPAKNESDVTSVALTPPITVGGETYHGLIFSVIPEGENSQVFVTRFRSEPDSFTENDLFDAGAWYEAGHFMDGLVASRLLYTSGFDVEISLTKIIADDAADMFYVGWRDETVGNGTLYLASVDAVAGTETTTPDPLDDFGPVAQGQSAYGMALGKDGSTDVLGLLYVDALDVRCRFSTYNKTTLARISGPHFLSAGACVYPHVFFDTTLERFVATYVDADHNTVIHTFEFDGGIQDASLTDMTIRNGSGLDNQPCSFAADFSDSLNRLVTFSVEGPCTAGSADTVLIDMYKTSVK